MRQFSALTSISTTFDNNEKQKKKCNVCKCNPKTPNISTELDSRTMMQENHMQKQLTTSEKEDIKHIIYA